MKLRELRAEAPEWAWSAERHGMGFQYIGERGAERVTVYAVAVLCGPAEDSYVTEWRVTDGTTSRGYASWWLEQATAYPASARAFLARAEPSATTREPGSRERTETCRYRIALTCAIPVACEPHGRDTCPVCDTCDCGAADG